MFSGTEIGAVCVALGSIAGAFTVYFKTRGKNGQAPKFCGEHKAMAQSIEGVKEDVKEIKATQLGNTTEITKIGQTTFEIKGILEGMARKK
jgi:hypothetical protein